VSRLAAMVLILGGLIGAVFAPLLIRPAVFRRISRDFPRNRLAGWALLAVDVWWSAVLLLKMDMGGLNKFKPLIYVLAPILFVLTAVFVDELLSGRALGGLLALIPAPIIDLARFHESPLRLLVISVCYALVLMGIILMLSPYRLRRWCGVLCYNDRRCRIFGVAGLALSGILIASAFTVFRLP